MEIRIFGMTVRLELLIITLIVGMIMGGHMLCACAKVPLSEAFSLNGIRAPEGFEGAPDAAAAAAANSSTDAAVKGSGNDSVDASGEPVSLSTSSTPPPAPANVPPIGGAKSGAEKISAGSVAGMTNIIPKALSGFQNILSTVTSSAAAHHPPSDTKDAFTDYASYKSGDTNSDVASSWINKAGAYSTNLGYQNTADKSNTYAGTRMPLPDGELFFFQNNQFKPECCPSPYSSTTGCACMSREQINYLNTRGGNRTSDSEF
jgi:hypothetical protein